MVGYVVETEPELFADVATYLLYSKFMCEQKASNFTADETAYSYAFSYILEQFEVNSNLALFNTAAFSKWIKLLQKIPDLKTQKL